MSNQDPADKIHHVNPQDLKPLPSNARVHSEEQIKAIADIIQSKGWTVPVLIDEENMIIAGHGRIEAAKLLERETVPAVIARGWSDEKKRSYALEDNLSYEMGDWDSEAFNLEYDFLEDTDYDLSETSLDFDMYISDAEIGEEEEDEIPEVPVAPKSKLGDVWILGNHRLMCGDSTSIEDMQSLVQENRVDLVFTDPPWNVAYGENISKDNAQNYKVRTIKNDNFENRKDWQDFLSGFIKTIVFATKQVCPIYCVMGPSEWPEIDSALRKYGFHWSSTIIWVKDRLIMSRKDYHTQYEPIWYGWKEGAGRLQRVEDRKQSDIWEVDRPHKSELHPTTKPTELIERAILNSSKANDFVLDAFGGSGSTLIACEKTTRKSFIMELDEKYVDVIIKRWQNYTGKKAINEETGERFPDE